MDEYEEYKKKHKKKKPDSTKWNKFRESFTGATIEEINKDKEKIKERKSRFRKLFDRFGTPSN
ncbi:MAG: hypothetical protein COB41_00465 [Proteobacteria bacterium]|nr:MAG: hypothetical protein COB41_00465 [Pseudomonadota bacterium]